MKTRVRPVTARVQEESWNTEPGYLRNFEGGHSGVKADPRFMDAARSDYRLRAKSSGMSAKCCSIQPFLGS